MLKTGDSKFELVQTEAWGLVVCGLTIIDSAASLHAETHTDDQSCLNGRRPRGRHPGKGDPRRLSTGAFNTPGRW